MTSHLIYGENNNTIVHQSKTTLYFRPGDEGLYEVVDIHFEGFEWVLVASWVNETDQTNTVSQDYRSELRIKSGQEIDDKWNFKAAFKQLEFGYDASTKRLTEEETTSQKGYTTTVHVGPHSSTYFYQKRYKFKPQVWFKHDAWNTLWTVGNWMAPGVAFKEGLVEIDSNEYFTTSNPLSGSAGLSVKGGDVPLHQDKLKPFQECTRACQDYLHDRGI